MGNQHSELSSPIADVIETKYIMAKELKESSNAVTNDGGPKVTNVLLLSPNIWRQNSLLKDLHQRIFDKCFVEVNVDKAWTSHFKFFNEFIVRNFGYNFCCNFFRF